MKCEFIGCKGKVTHKVEHHHPMNQHRNDKEFLCQRHASELDAPITVKAPAWLKRVPKQMTAIKL